MGAADGSGYWGVHFVNVSSDSVLISQNSIDGIGGYAAIWMNCNNCTVQNNLINHFCENLDDGAGVYINGQGPNKKVINNIILNGIGNNLGSNDTALYANGIYMDDNTINLEIKGNTIANCAGSGIYIHNAQTASISNNTIYNCQTQLHFSENNSNNLTLRNINTKKNIFFSKTASQGSFYLETMNGDYNSIYLIDSNYYCRPFGDNFLFMVYNSTNSKTYVYDLPYWQNQFAVDQHSYGSPLQYKAYTINSLGGNLYPYGTFDNNINYVYTYSPDGNISASWKSGILDGGSLQFYFASASDPNNYGDLNFPLSGTITSGKTYIVRFSAMGTTYLKNIQLYLREDSTPYRVLSNTKRFTIPANPTRTENEFLLTANQIAPSHQPALLFTSAEQLQAMNFDNVYVYPANVTMTNPDDSLLFVYNASSSATTTSFNGSYIDVYNNSYNSSIKLYMGKIIYFARCLQTVGERYIKRD